MEEVTEALRRDVRDSGIDYAGGQDVRRRVYRGTGGQRNMSDEDADIYRRYRSTASRVRRQAYGGRATRAGAQPAQEQRRKFSGAKSFFFQKNITKSNGIGQIVAGGIGLLFSLPAVLSNAVGLIVGGGGFGVAFGLLASALIAAASAYLLVKGRRESELVDRYRQYGTAIGKAEYIELEKLARATGRTKQEVRDDLQKMIDKGFLKEAWIDDQGTTLMLSEDVYNQYQNLKTERAARLQQEEQVLSEDADLPQEAQQILREGRAYIQTIHQFNKEIPGEEMFDESVIVDLSRVGSAETKSLIMGLLVLKLQEHRMTKGDMNAKLRHVTVLEEAHNLLKRTSTEQSQDSGNLLGKSVEMLSNSIAEMRTYGEGFVIADQAPGLLDMAAIRNTNTKIVLRTPEGNDRDKTAKKQQ